MEDLQVSFLLKAYSSVLQSKTALIVCFPPFLLILLLAFSPLESSRMLTIWQALPGLLEEPALAFLLLNCVTLTIIASSKLGSKKTGHEEEGQGQVAMKVAEKGDEKGEDVLETAIGLSLYLDTEVENGHQKGDDFVESIVRPSLYLHTPFKTCPDFYKSKGGSFLRRCWSLNASFQYKTKNEQVKLNHVKEKKLKPSRSRGRLGSRRTDKVGIDPMSTDMQKKQLARGSLTSSGAAKSEATLHDEKPALKDENSDSTVDEQCTKGCTEHAASVTDQGPSQAAAGNPAPAAGNQTAHPSMDEVWAAIMSSKKSDDRMASCLQARKRSRKPNSKTVNKQHQPAAAAASATTHCATAALPAAAAVAPLAAATAASKSPKLAAGKVANAARKAAAEKHVEHRNGCTEVEELHHRANEFIQRFNHQIRLQREESLEQHQQKMRGRRACNYDVQQSRKSHTPGLRPVPARGLLAG